MGRPVWPSLFVPMKSPICDALLATHLPGPEPCKHPHNIPLTLQRCDMSTVWCDRPRFSRSSASVVLSGVQSKATRLHGRLSNEFIYLRWSVWLWSGRLSHTSLPCTSWEQVSAFRNYHSAGHQSFDYLLEGKSRVKHCRPLRVWCGTVSGVQVWLHWHMDLRQSWVHLEMCCIA